MLKKKRNMRRPGHSGRVAAAILGSATAAAVPACPLAAAVRRMAAVATFVDDLACLSIPSGTFLSACKDGKITSR